jgi:hypothetical protein
MALLTNVQQIGFGTLMVPAAVSASDTINLTSGSMILEVINGGGSPDTVTIVDPGATPAGSAGTSPTSVVAAGTRKEFLLSPYFSNTSGIITVTHSFTTTVTYNLKRA